MCEGYLAGGDTELDLTTVFAMGQTFSPLVTHKLEFIDITCRTWGPYGHLHAHVYDLEKDPNMIGGGISTSKYVNFEKSTSGQLRRIRFIMRKEYLHIGKNYGFWFHFDPEPVWDKYKCLYDADDATYPRGQRFTKDSWLGPPTYYPNDDLMFFEFGTPVAKPIPPDPPPWPPPTPPDPTIENWTIIQGAQRRTKTGERMIAYTNVPCHLWLRWTTVKPGTHTKSKRTRGLLAMTDLYFCFDVFTDYPQQEPGDTLEHTFIVEPWPLCEQRYFYYHGTVNGTPSPSTSPIFTKHPIAPLPPTCLYPVPDSYLPWNPYPASLLPNECIDEDPHDGDATYLYRSAGWTGTNRIFLLYPDLPDFDIGTVTVTTVMKQLPRGPSKRWRVNVLPHLLHLPSSTYYWGHNNFSVLPESYIVLTNSFPNNPHTHEPWTYSTLKGFSPVITFRFDYTYPYDYYGDQRMTQAKLCWTLP